MKTIKPIIFAILLTFLGIQSSYSQEGTNEKNQIEKIILKCYIEPLYLDKDLDKIIEGFHPSFNMYVLYKEQFYLTPRDEWIEKIKETRSRNLLEKEYKWEFSLIDHDKQTAVVKLIIHENGVLKYVDYLTLYKFKDGWKVITKQFSIY